MAAFIAKQPNGLYCRFSLVVDCLTHWNMTAEEYVELCKQKAEREAREVLANHLQPFKAVEGHFRPLNMTREKFKEAVAQMSSPVDDSSMQSAGDEDL